MNRIIALLLLTTLATGSGIVLADGRGHGGGRGGGHGADHGAHVGVRVGPVVPVPVIRPVVRARIAVAAPVAVVGGYYYYGYPYYYSPYYYPPAYPVDEAPPTYIEQSSEVRYYCADLRDYYPTVPTCPSPWMNVLPNSNGEYPR